MKLLIRSPELRNADVDTSHTPLSTPFSRRTADGNICSSQSTSIALLDAGRNGVVLSSIMHRDAGRLYAKQVRAGVGHVVALSPEEAEAVRLALEGDDEPEDDDRD